MKKERKGLKRICALVLAMVLMWAAMEYPVLAAIVGDNPAGTIIGEVVAGDTMLINNGTVATNNGIIDTNKNVGVVDTNDGEINHNYGTVTNHNGIMSYNYATITNNKGEVIENHQSATINNNSATVAVNYGTVSANIDTGRIHENRGTVNSNAGHIEINFGTVTNNTGTVEENYGGNVTGGNITHNYKYNINYPATANLVFFSDAPGAVNDQGGTVWIKENTSVRITAQNGYKLTGAPIVTGGTLTDNGDGSYTLSNVTGNITLTATTEATSAGNVNETTPGGNGGETTPSNNGDVHTHSFIWIKTLEPTETTDGLLEYKCEGCGHVEAKQPITFFGAILKNTIQAINEAPANGTVTVENTFLRCFSNEIVEALLARPDVTVKINFTDQGVAYSLTIPAGQAPTDGQDWYGYYYLATLYGWTSIVPLTENHAGS